MATKRGRKRKRSAEPKSAAAPPLPKDDPPLSLQPLQFTDAVGVLVGVRPKRTAD